MYNLHLLKTKSPKNTVRAFFWINFSSDILSGKLTKFAGHFWNLAVLFDRPAVFAKTVAEIYSCLKVLMDPRTPARLPSYMLTLGSGELKKCRTHPS